VKLKYGDESQVSVTGFKEEKDFYDPEKGLALGNRPLFKRI
jgi:hypothetical protein